MLRDADDKAMEWILTCDDLFDRECPPMVEAEGKDLLDGLTLLWSKHLREGLQDDGQRTFCRFGLSWSEAGVTVAATDVDYYLRHHAAGAPKLRRWLLSGGPQPLLSILARAHLRLLQRCAQGAADCILEAAAKAEDRSDLERRLTRMA